MTKIEKLTPEQISKFPDYVKKWLEIGLSTAPIDRERASIVIDKVYKCAGKQPPKIKVFLDSPFGGAVGAVYLKELNETGAQVRAQVWDQVGAQVRDQVGAQVGAQVRAQVWAQVRAQVRDQVRAQVRAQVGAQVRAQVGAQVGAQVYKAGYGSQDAGWLSFYDFFLNETGFKDCEKLYGLMLSAMEMGWFWPFENAVIITPRPTLLKRDDQNRLHCENGPAIQYPDGWSIYAWHGTRIPEEWIKDKNSITPDIALKWENAEQRRCAMEIVGWSKMLDLLNAKEIDKDDDPTVGILYEANHKALGGKCKFLKMYCPTGRWFAEPVPPEMKTALEANAWGWDLPKELYQPRVQA